MTNKSDLQCLSYINLYLFDPEMELYKGGDVIRGMGKNFRPSFHHNLKD